MFVMGLKIGEDPETCMHWISNALKVGKSDLGRFD